MSQVSFFTLLILFFTSCTRVQPYIVQYTLNTNVNTNVNKQTQCKEKTLKVAHAFSPNSLMIEEMNYMSGKYTMETFTQSQWIQTPNNSITMQTIQAVEMSHLYKYVSGAESRVKSDLILENSIEEFIQYFSENETESHVKIVLSATLVDRKTKKSLGHKRFEKIKKSDSLNAYGGVVALNKALTEVLEDEVMWLGETCR